MSADPKNRSPGLLNSFWQKLHAKRTQKTQERNRFFEESQDTPVSVPTSAAPRVSYGIAKPAAVPAGWVAEGTPLRIGGLTLNTGLLYYGEKLETPTGELDPCLIDPTKSLAPLAAWNVPALGYWPNYSRLTPEMRRDHILWIASGRKDPNIDPGHVRLHFYALERRIAYDWPRDGASRYERTRLTQELERLKEVYESFDEKLVASIEDLLRWAVMSTGNLPQRLYEGALPDLNYGATAVLSMQVKIALGQLAIDKVPLSSSLALTACFCSKRPDIQAAYLNTQDEFAKLFAFKYEQQYPQGLILTDTPDRLELAYRFESPAFRDYPASIELDLPDVLASAEFDTVRDIARDTKEELSAYARLSFRARSPDSVFERLSVTPLPLWPLDKAAQLLKLTHDVTLKCIESSFNEVWLHFESSSDFKKSEVLGLVALLQNAQIGMQPNPLTEPKLPQATDRVVLFRLPESIQEPLPKDYTKWIVQLQLLIPVLYADGSCSKAKLAYLDERIAIWEELSRNTRAQLSAYLRWAGDKVPTAGTLKKKLVSFSMEEKMRIGALLIGLSQCEGLPSPKTLTVVQKAYKALGLDATQMFSAIHQASTGSASVATQEVFALDLDKVAQLKRDTHHVTAILADIFQEDTAEAAPNTGVATAQSAKISQDTAPVAQGEIEAKSTKTSDAPAQTSVAGLTGLNPAHAQLARLILEKSPLSRADLAQTCAQLDLMTDGALEYLNDLSFEVHGIAFCEGEDPVTLNPEILEML